MNTILSQNISPPPPPFSAQKIILAKKRGTTATAGVSPTMYSAISPHEQ